MSEGFEFVAMGRALLREPDLVNRIAADASTPSLCIHCNRCMPTNFIGTHCPIIDEAAPGRYLGDPGRIRLTLFTVGGTGERFRLAGPP